MTAEELEVSPVEILALKKIALIAGALMASLNSPSSRTELRMLLQVLMDVTSRLEHRALARSEAEER